MASSAGLLIQNVDSIESYLLIVDLLRVGLLKEIDCVNELV
jgi:hypothetical protein